MKLNVTQADLQELARQVSRYEHGVCPETRLTEQFEEALSRLQALLVEWRPLLRGLRHRPTSLMRDCDDALSLAHRSCRSKQYKQGLSHIKLVRHGLALLQELLEAYGEYGFATDAYQKLKIMLNSEHLTQLLTIETIARLLTESDKLLAAGRSRQAVFIARLCRNKALALQEVSSELTAEESAKIQGLAIKIKEQSDFFAQTEAFASSNGNDLKLRYAFERLPDLLAQRRLTSVARLLDDIDYELAVRRAVWVSFQHHHHLHDKSDVNTQRTRDELKRLIRQESWEKAATYVLQQRLTKLSSESHSLQQSIEQVTQKMEAIYSNGSDLQPEAASKLD